MPVLVRTVLTAPAVAIAESRRGQHVVDLQLAVPVITDRSDVADLDVELRMRGTTDVADDPEVWFESAIRARDLLGRIRTRFLWH